ncbi:MAG TPA: alpha-ketoacid dehydrogenase subunit beta [Spirochaetes bacterium]|nr:alpha-ketoacid dehydrogenase subunit beta [Spirochaetota bacterium]
MREILLVEAIREALSEEMRRDESVFLMGEDLRIWGAPLGQTKGLWDEFGDKRVLDTPISEAGFVGAGAGAASLGLRPVVELMFIDFFGVAGDQIFNQAPKLRYMFGGRMKVPMVLRTVIGAGMSAAAHHSSSAYSIIAHIPGWKCVIPSTAYDAKGLLKTAIRDDDPVMYFEHKMLLNVKGEVPEEEYTIPFGEASIKRKGKDVTVVALAWMVHKALKAAEKLSEEGIDVEVIDPRTIVPLDKKTIIDSVRKTGKLVAVDEDYERCGFSSEISAMVTEEAFDSLTAPIMRVATPTVPIPFSPVLEDAVIPNEDRIIKTVREAALYKKSKLQANI